MEFDCDKSVLNAYIEAADWGMDVFNHSNHLIVISSMFVTTATITSACSPSSRLTGDDRERAG